MDIFGALVLELQFPGRWSSRACLAKPDQRHATWPYLQPVSAESRLSIPATRTGYPDRTNAANDAQKMLFREPFEARSNGRLISWDDEGETGVPDGRDQLRKLNPFDGNAQVADIPGPCAVLVTSAVVGTTCRSSNADSTCSTVRPSRRLLRRRPAARQPLHFELQTRDVAHGVRARNSTRGRFGVWSSGYQRRTVRPIGVFGIGRSTTKPRYSFFIVAVAAGSPLTAATSTPRSTAAAK